MNSLALFENKGQILVSSRIVAQDFDKRHNSVVATIDNLIDDVQGSTLPMYAPVFLEWS